MTNIRQGKIRDFDQLKTDWAWGGSKLLEEYIEKIKKGWQEFFVVEDDEKVIGEVHLFWQDNDKDQADGEVRAYISALRINPRYQGQGLGTKLMECVFERIQEKGFGEATIGAYADEERTQKWYQKLGFVEKVKTSVEKLEGLEPRDYILFLKKF